MFDLYCWIHSTYTIPRALSLHVGRDVAHPGVMTSAHDQEDERRYVTYYQWVGFTLFFQAILFYIPRWLWKNWEAGRAYGFYCSYSFLFYAAMRIKTH